MNENKPFEHEIDPDLLAGGDVRDQLYSFKAVCYLIPLGKCSLYLRKKVGWLISRRSAAL